MDDAVDDERDRDGDRDSIDERQSTRESPRQRRRESRHHECGPTEPWILRCGSHALATSNARGGAGARRRHAPRSEIAFDELAHRILDAPEQRAAQRAWARADAGGRRAREPAGERAGPDMCKETAPREISATDERRLVRRQLP